MDKEFAVSVIALGIGAVFAGALVWMAYDQHKTQTYIRFTHSEVLRIAMEQDLARRAGLE